MHNVFSLVMFSVIFGSVFATCVTTVNAQTADILEVVGDKYYVNVDGNDYRVLYGYGASFELSEEDLRKELPDLLSINLNVERKSLEIQLENVDESFLFWVMPDSELLSAENYNYQVFVNSKNTLYDLVIQDKGVRIGFVIPSGTQDVEIIGTKVTDQFEVVIPPYASNPKNPFHFIPSDLKIMVLDTVKWENADSVIHTVTSGSFGSGPDGIFNSGPLEPGGVFSYQFLLEDSGIVTYFCTIHPWVNGIVEVQDPEGTPVTRIGESVSIESAEMHVIEGDKIAELALKLNEFDDVINSHRQAAHHYNSAAMEYSLLGENQNAAKYYQESGKQYHYAALQLENSGKIQESIKHHFLAGTEYHNAALEFNAMQDYENYGKQFAESLMHKRMAQYGSDYVLPPKQQMRWLSEPHDVQCSVELELVFKSTNGEPVCFTPESASKLVQRGWAKR